MDDSSLLTLPFGASPLVAKGCGIVGIDGCSLVDWLNFLVIGLGFWIFDTDRFALYVQVDECHSRPILRCE
jgi:hypothetical protein